MGGGGDSRIPSILREHIGEAARERGLADEYDVVVRTYSFDPEEGAGQIASWVRELKPSLVIGESLGANQAIRIKGVPHLFVSPSLGAPKIFGSLAFLARVPGMTLFLDWLYRPKEGDRQPLHFTFSTLRKYRGHRHLTLANTTAAGSKDYFFAFFGTRDHYRLSGVVSIRQWRRLFGEGTWTVYEGTHFMEEEYIHSLLIPKIFRVLGNDL